MQQLVPFTYHLACFPNRTQMQAYVNRLRHAAYIVIAIMLAIEVASFTSYYVQLLAQNTQID
jgi:hypothetical protein